MTNLNTIIRLSALCEKHDIELKVDGSGIEFSAYRNGRILNKRYDLDIIGKIVKELPIEVLVDLFIEESILKFKRAIC
jgi:hypothetical protein